jgi:SAM-dependent methyltransferase
MWSSPASPSARPPLQASRYYDGLISEMYDQSWYSRLTDAEVAYYRALMSGKTAFELAVGTGRLSIPLLDAGIDLYGIDGSPAMLSQLHAKLDAAGRSGDMARFIEWEALATPYPCEGESFDVAIVPFASFSLIHSNMSHPVEENRILREFNRLLRPGGIAVINDYRLGRFDEALLRTGQTFNHDHHHPQHGPILEEQVSTFAIEPNPLIEKQILRRRVSRLIRKSDGVVLREHSDVTPLWDLDTFPILGRDAGFEYLRGDVVDFYADRTINHVFRKTRPL